MSQSDFNLQELQEAVVGVPRDLILPEEFESRERELKQQSIRKIVDMYSTCRTNGRIYKATYDALADANPFVRVAAADLISKSGTQNSFDYLFKALEDEVNTHVKREIALAINKLETRLHDEPVKQKVEGNVSFIKSMRILEHS